MHSDARLQFRYFPDIERELLIRAHTQKTWLTLTEIYKDHVVVPIAVAFGETTHAPCGLQGIADSAQQSAPSTLVALSSSSFNEKANSHSKSEREALFETRSITYYRDLFHWRTFIAHGQS
jgi:hypothetical protein